MPTIGETKMRYPGNNPEDGPAYLQRWTGLIWECDVHHFKAFEEQDIDDATGLPTGGKYTITACVNCGTLR